MISLLRPAGSEIYHSHISSMQKSTATREEWNVKRLSRSSWRRSARRPTLAWQEQARVDCSREKVDLVDAVLIQARGDASEGAVCVR